ncbi:MAG: hypothetical protein ABIQ86_13475 [Steroidobacteraceae bacterium]
MRALALILLGFLLAALFVWMVGGWKKDGTRWVATWAVLTTLAFFCVDFIVFAVILAIACAMLAKRAPDRVAALYAMLLPMLPTYTYYIPGILGINAIFPLNYVRVLALALLLPAYISLRRTGALQDSRAMRNGLDAIFVAYVLWYCFLAVYHKVTVTDSMRVSVEMLLFTLIPYLAVSRLLRTREQINDLISAVAFSGLVVSAMCVIEMMTNSHPYQVLPYRLDMEMLSGFSYQTQFRFGMIRAQGTFDGGLGLYAVFALGALLCKAQVEKMPRWRLWLGMAILAIPIISTGSRGTWIITGMMLATRFGFWFIRTPARFVTVLTLVMVLIPRAQDAFITHADDQFGTFDYREQLLDTFVPVVWEAPIAGQQSLLALYATGRFNYLVQGEGIIDMVNTYLGEALVHGIPGLIFFAGIFLFSVLTPLRQMKRASPEEAGLDYPIVMWICSLMPAAAFLLVTTSLVGHMWPYISLVAGVSSALAALGESRSFLFSPAPATPG